MYGSRKNKDLSRQDSLPVNGGSRNGIYEEKHIEMTNRTDGEGNLRSTVTPPLTSDSFNNMHSSRIPSGLQNTQRSVQYINQRTSSQTVGRSTPGQNLEDPNFIDYGSNVSY